MRFKKIDLFLVVFLFFFALILRLANLDAYLATDGADYVRAAKKGFLVNYLDLESRPTLEFIKEGLKAKLADGDVDVLREDYENEDISALRHYHSPLVIYFMQFFIFLFGSQETIVRLTSLVFGAISCAVLYLISVRSFEEYGRFLGIAASVLLATTVLHVEVSKYVSWHATYMLWEVVTIFFMCQAIKQYSTKFLYWSFCFLSLSLLTLEYAPLLLFTLMISLLFIKNKWLSVSKERILVSNQLFAGFFLVAMIVFAVWPASFLNLSILKNYMVYAKPIITRTMHFGRQERWFTAYTVFFMRHAYLSVLIIGSLVYTFYLIIKKRFPTHNLPFLIYPILMFIVNLRVSFLKGAYISHLLPFLVILCAITLSQLFKSNSIAMKATPIIFLSIIALTSLKGILGAYSGSYYMRDVISFFESEKRSSILVAPEGYAAAYEYYLPEQNIAFYYHEKDELDLILKKIKEGSYEYFIFSGSKFGVNSLEVYPYIENDFVLLRTFRDRGGKEAQIFKLLEK